MCAAPVEVGSFRPHLVRQRHAELEAACSSKRGFLVEHIDRLCANTNPASLWASIVKHRDRQGDGEGKDEEDEVIESYDELQLTYDGYHRMAHELLFGPSSGATGEEAAAREREIFFAHPFLSPATFLAFARSDSGTVPAVPLYAFVAKRLLLLRLRVQLELMATVSPPVFRDTRAAVANRLLLCPPSTSSPLSSGLTQEDVEGFVRGLVPNLRLVRDMPPWMQPYYLCHASRKFMFMCDSRNVGALSIDTIMTSDVFSELLRMFESDAGDAITVYPEGCAVEVAACLATSDASPDDTVPGIVKSVEGDGTGLDDVYTVQLLEDGRIVKVQRRHIYWNSASTEYLSVEMLNMDNWFSLALMGRIYEHFTALDVDGDGVLTADELLHYSNDSFTPLAIARVFECHVQHSGTRHIMDYKTYLNFVIATEHAATRPAMKYIWSVLDLDGTHTLIKLPTLHCFCKELATELVSSGLMVDISAQSILCEVVDMINPEWHEWVTFDDIERSGQQATVLPILLSFKNFYAYDCREQTAASAADEYTTEVAEQ